MGPGVSAWGRAYKHGVGRTSMGPGVQAWGRAYQHGAGPGGLKFNVVSALAALGSPTLEDYISNMSLGW